MDAERRWRATILGATGLVVACGTVSALCAIVYAGDRAPAIVATVASSTVLIVGQIVLLGYQLRHAEETRRWQERHDNQLEGRRHGSFE